MYELVNYCVIRSLRRNPTKVCVYVSRVHAVAHLRQMRLESLWQYDLWGTSAVMDDNYSDTKRSVRKNRANRAVEWLNKVLQSTRWGDGEQEW